MRVRNFFSVIKEMISDILYLQDSFRLSVFFTAVHKDILTCML